MRADDSGTAGPDKARTFPLPRLAGGILLGLMLAGCQTAGGQRALDEANDPLEPSNRAVFE
ncbi:MAG: MlaA family lipoprotein, partial [Geminicoccales bacterium]